jgi:N-acetylglutamate synthase-like GNAT family acetyltransferase
MIIRPATSADDLAEVKRLFREYVEWLAVDLSFQNFDEELAGLPGDYAPPAGGLWVAEEAGHVGGCVALRRLEQHVCEMKRLFVRPEFRGTGLGRRLVEHVMQQARAIGYQRMRLDTLPQMSAAQGLYQSFGFRQIDPYRFNPIVGTKFLEAEL